MLHRYNSGRPEDSLLQKTVSMSQKGAEVEEEGEEELKNRMVDLANLDLAIKSGKIDKWLGLAKFIVDAAE